MGLILKELVAFILGRKLLGAGIQWDGFGLEDLTKKYLDKDRDKTLQKSFINHKCDFSSDQLAYAAQDTSDVILLYNAMKKKIQEEGLEKVWEIENNALPAFADIYFYGLKIDTPSWKKIMDDNLSKLKEAESKLGGFFEPFFDRDLFGNLDINYASQPTILHGLQRMGIKVDGNVISDTNDTTRKKIGHIPVIGALNNYRAAQKALGTYGQPYLDAIHAVTGRIHPRIDQLGTDTGRPTCPKPNVLNVPRSKFYRNAFVTDFGRLISTVDYSGAELRILADRSGDPLMVEGFNKGVDFHCYVASMLFGREVLKDDPIRTPTKTLNFGLAYGMGPGKLFAKLNGEGHKISLEECKTLFRLYKETFRVAIAYLESNKKVGRTNLEMTNVVGRKRRWTAPNFYKAVAAVKLEVLGKKNLQKELSASEETRLNQLAHEKVKMQWAAIEREAANFDIQSTNAEWTKISMYEMRKEFKRLKYDAKFYNSVYDETVIDSAERDAQAVHALQKKIMMECGQRYCSKVPVTVEGHLAPY